MKKRVNATHRSCRFRPPAGRPRVVAGGAGPQVSSVLGVFRRPPTEEERALGARLPDAPSAGLAGGAAPPREGVRLVRAPSGRAILLTALRDVPPLGPTRKTFDRCQALVAAELARLARSAPRDVRGLGSRVTLIVPDGVATIEATFPRVRSRGRLRAPKRYRTTLRRTLTVHDNAAFATVARSPEDAFPRMVGAPPTAPSCGGWTGPDRVPTSGAATTPRAGASRRRRRRARVDARRVRALVRRDDARAAARAPAVTRQRPSASA